MSSHFLRADKRILDFHAKAEFFARFVSKEAQSETSTKTLSKGAMHVSTIDAVALHRSIFSLCKGGWAFSCPIILRTMIDILINVAVIVTSNNPELLAFKYFHASTKQLLLNENVPQETKEHLKKGLEKNGFDKLAEPTLS